jgi:hypothetical protein
MWFADQWRVGQHKALVGPTDSGKTTYAVPVLKLRKYVIALDPKGGDSRLAKSGFTPCPRWPPDSKILDGIAEGKPARLVVGFPCRTIADKKRLRTLQSNALEGAFEMGGWTVYMDEFQVLADRRMMGLDKLAEELLISARDPKRMTIVTAYQAPAWVPTASTRQAQWFAIWKTLDVNIIKALAEKMGRDWREMIRIMRTVPRHHIVIGGTDTDAPLIITKAPRLS